MSEVSVNIMMDEELRDRFGNFCANIGLSMSAVISRLARQAVNTNMIPSEDPFYSAANIRRLERAADDDTTTLQGASNNMEIQNLLSSPLYTETLSKFRDKARENARQSFADFIDSEKSQSPRTDSNIPANITADNGVKSAVMMSRLSSQEAQNTGTMTTVKLTKEEADSWKSGKLPEGLRFTNAGGVIFSGGRKAYNDYFNVYYTDGADYDYSFAAFYDENSPEDNPVIYLTMSASGPDSLHYDDFINCKEIVKVEVSRVNPANASYEEMIALAAYIYRDDPMGASEACEAIDMTRKYMQSDGLDWQNGTHDYTSYYLPEVVRRNRDSTNPANQALAKATEPLLEYLKDYPRGKTENA